MHVTFTFSPREEDLLGIVCANNLFFFFDIVKKRLNDWSRDNRSTFSQEYLDTKSRIVGLKFHPKLNWVLLYSDRTMFYLNLDQVK
jgi:hypothetical protein